MKIRNILASIGMIGFALGAAAGEVGKSTPAGFTDDFEAAKAEAAKSDRNVLAVFSGSDWCHWCKVLERDYLSKPEFVEEARKDFVLVFVDNPKEESVLSETARRNNRTLTERYKVRGFPTVKILDAKGEPIADCRPGDGVTPRDYALQLRREAKVGPLVRKHLGPFEDEMRKTMRQAYADMAMKAQEAARGKEGEEAEKAQFEAGHQMMAALVGKIKALAEKVKAAQVPDEIETEKQSLLQSLEAAIEQLEQSLKMTYDDVKELKQRVLEDAEAGETRVRGLVVPLPGDAKLETEYFDTVSMPFYTKWIVDAYRPAADVKPETAERVRQVRRALVRSLATARFEFPTHAEFELAHALWRENCRDAAVAILHADGLFIDDRRWQSERIYNEAIAAFDFDADPFMGFLLRTKALRARRFLVDGKPNADTGPVRAAEVACSNAFPKVADIFRAADRRIAERLDEQWGLPDGAGERLGNDYLACCQRAQSCMERASDARGGDIAANLTDEQIRGWREYNSQALSNLTAAVALRPEDARAAMMLASLDARWSCGAGDPVALMNRAVSNSLDRAAESIERVLHFQTSRWGGSTEFLLDAIRAASTNVCTQSTFAYRVAAEAVNKLFYYEMEDVANTNLANTVLTPEISARLYAMFDAYIAAPESAYMPSRDIFVGMAVSLALQRRDWPAVRRYAAQYAKPVCNWQDAWWIRRSVHAGERNYIMNMFKIVGGDPKHRDLFIDAEIALAEGRYADAEGIYRGLLAEKDLTDAGKLIACRQGFRARRLSQEARGGWVDIMPTATAEEAMSFWAHVATQADGRARVAVVPGDRDYSYYLLLQSLPGKGAEFEASVHFETNDVHQTRWFIGWGMARHYTGHDAETARWAFPYVGFYRDETGDNVSVQCPTQENTGKDKPVSKLKYGPKEGMYQKWVVYDGALERRDTHDFRLRWDDERLVVSVDGREVWSIPTGKLMSNYYFRDYIQSDFSILPIWKVFRNTSFSGYRYRIIK